MVKTLTPLCPACGESDAVGPLAEALPYLDNASVVSLAPPDVTNPNAYVRWLGVPAGAMAGLAAQQPALPFDLAPPLVVPILGVTAWLGYKSLAALSGRDQKRWDAMYRRWQRAWWCERDRGVFVPGETGLLAAADFGTWIAGGTAR